MASLSTPSSLPEPSSYSFLSASFMTPKKKIRRRKVPIITIQAPLEVVSFFYRLWQEADEQKQSRTAFMPDDTPIPDPLRLLSSSLGTPHFQMSSSHSFGEVRDFERISRSWFLDDEGNAAGSLPLLFSDTRSDLRNDEQFLDEKLDIVESSKQGSFNNNSPMIRRKMRAYSTDFAYSEANEVSRIDVDMLKSPQAREKFVLEEKKEELPLIHIAKVRLKTGGRGIIFSKPMLKRKEKRYKRQKDDFAKTYLMQNRLLKSTVLQQKAATTSHRRAFSTVPSVPMLEELNEEELYISLSENLVSCNALDIKHISG